ncbi:DinB family protein [bacterium]|nr:DinB family protein [Akkermansiaceae bacterium]MDB4629952.1 DinB family protein [Akkermansiaceae bacterium]MDB4732027.1 DinB family protein [bacterium]
MQITTYFTFTLQVISKDPNLEKPGAGLRKREKIIMGIMFPILRNLKSREFFSELFAAEQKKIELLLGSLSEEQARQQILIKRIRGIEDSSRHWSAYMTISHLNIVNLGIAGVIRSLGRGKPIDAKIRIEDVKPTSDTGPEALEAFEKTSAILKKSVAGVEDLKTTQTHHHPWFGALDAKGWHALTAIHMRIHRKQIELVITGL